MIKIFILGECWLGLCGRSSMIKVIRDLKAMNVLAKFENDPRKITNVRALTELVCHAPHLGNNTPEHYKGCGVKKWPTFEAVLIFRIWWIDLSVRWACIWWVYPPSRFSTRGRLPHDQCWTRHLAGENAHPPVSTEQSDNKGFKIYMCWCNFYILVSTYMF